jgi:hypothetical protein
MAAARTGATVAAASPSPTPPASVTAAPTETSEAGWQRVTVDGAGISFEVPADWVPLPDGAWAAPEDPEACRQLTVLPLDTSASACGGLLTLRGGPPNPALTEQTLLPNHFRALSSSPDNVPPLGLVTRYEGVLEGSAALPGLLAYQLHIVGLSDKFALDVSMSARTQEALDAATPVLDHVVRSVEFVP